MNNLYAGFSRVNITPMMGISIQGYYKLRLADGVLDELQTFSYERWKCQNKSRCE